MLSENLINQLLEAAQAAAPKEMCGLLFHNEPFYVTKNRAVDPYHRFEISQYDYLRACMKVGEKPWGVVHSHVEKGAGLSRRDYLLLDALALTANKDLKMVIVGLRPKEIRIFTHGKPPVSYQLLWVWPTENKSNVNTADGLEHVPR